MAGHLRSRLDLVAFSQPNPHALVSWQDRPDFCRAHPHHCDGADIAVPDGFYACLVRTTNPDGSSDWTVAVTA